LIKPTLMKSLNICQPQSEKECHFKTAFNTTDRRKVNLFSLTQEYKRDINVKSIAKMNSTLLALNIGFLPYSYNYHILISSRDVIAW
jgi:hypothetical protein